MWYTSPGNLLNFGFLRQGAKSGYSSIKSFLDFWSPEVWYIKQLLGEVFHEIQNYQDKGEVSVIVRGW